MLDMIAVGEKIKSNRIKNKMSQDELSEKLYVTRQAVSRWEMGNAFPTIDNLYELSKLFAISLEELLCMYDDFKIDAKNIFLNHDRSFIIRGIINHQFNVVLSEVFYQMSNEERLLILKAIKENKLQEDENLWVKLTNLEKQYFNEKRFKEELYEQKNRKIYINK